MLFMNFSFHLRKRSVVFLLIVLLYGIDCLILRLPCQIEAYFTIYKSRKYLKNAFLQYIATAGYGDCITSCIKHPKCKSINHRTNSSGCELNTKYAEMNGAVLGNKANWSYASTDYETNRVCSVLGLVFLL